MPAHATGPQELRLECVGCGAVLGLDRRAPLVRRVRPFLEEHRSCPGASTYDIDREMRTAFKIPA
jgi:hypothetical protein